jgi:excinuclease ABC subunit A
MDVYFKNYNISEILNITIDEALEVFKEKKQMIKILTSMSELGLGYLTLGQSTKTISGGEAQRLKLALELNNTHSKEHMYVLDEPSAGLSSYDIKGLIVILKRLVQNGNSVIVIEHDLQIITMCDWIIELGPKSGAQGGKIISEGSISDMIENPESIIGKYCQDYLNND